MNSVFTSVLDKDDLHHQAFNFIHDSYLNRVSGAKFIVGVAGGSVLSVLQSVLDKHWGCLGLENWVVFVVDERCVPVDDPESNYGTFCRLFLELEEKPSRYGYFSAPQIVSVEDSLSQRGGEKMARHYEEVIRVRLGSRSVTGSPLFDLLILGVGEDGHVASLFPGRCPNQEAGVVFVDNSPKPPPARLSLSYGWLNRSSDVCYLLQGPAKLAIFEDVKNNVKEKYPAQKVFGIRHTQWIYLDFR